MTQLPVHRRLRLTVCAGLVGLIVVSASAMAQATSVTAIEGTVKDAASGVPLQNAQVYIGGQSGIGTSTNTAGNYRLTNVPVGTVDVRVRLIGYGSSLKSVTVTVGQTARVDFQLTQSALQLEAIVTTGTGTAVETKKLGNTVGTVDMEELKAAPIQNPSEALAARIPGVSVLPSSGVSGAGARIRIRGNASLSQSNNPIIYIDGVRSDNGGSNIGGGIATSRLDDLDQNSIDHIEVLKGAAAATLYGTEASNGVIQIFTKRGKQGAARWSLDASTSRIGYPDRVAPNAVFARTQAQADSLSALFFQTITPFKPFTYNVTNQLWDNGYNNTVNSSVTGGAEKVTYFVAGRYEYEDGPFTAERFGGLAADIVKRTQGTLSLSVFPREKVNIGFQSRYTAFHTESPEGSNSIYSPYAQSMYARPDQGYCQNPAGQHALGDAIAGPGQCRYYGNPYGNTLSTTLREALMHSIYQDGTHYTGSLSAKWTPTTEINFDATGGLDNTSVRGVSFLPFGNNVDHFSQNAPDGSRNLDELWQQNVTLDTKVSWDHQLSQMFRSTAVIGAQGFITDQRDDGGSNRNFAGPGLGVVGAGNQPTVNETLIKVVNAGYFAQEQLGINDWIFTTVGARYDYNSAFGQSSGGVLYPKASISIVPSDRKSWKSEKLSALRVRAAIGRSGRQPGAFDKFTTYAAQAASTGGGLIPSNLGNPDLKPEVSTEIEAGAELGLFNNRASLGFSNWNRTLTNALVQKQYPISGGFAARQLSNIGEMKAHGWEVTASGFVVNKPNVALDLFANGSYLWQKVTSLGGAPPIKVQGNYVRIRGFIREGYAPGALFGAKIMAPCSSYKNPSTDAKGGCLQPGQTPYDLNNDGKPDTEAELRAALASPFNPTNLKLLRADDDGNNDFLDHYQGKIAPDWQGAFGGKLRLRKNWTVSTLFEYKQGNYTITDLTDAFRNASPTLGRNKLGPSTVEATLLNPASTADQRYAAAQQWLGLVALSPYDGFNQNKPGDFVRWRELSVTYVAPQRLAARFGARDMSLVASARNLMLWTRYPGTDPESNFGGTSNSLNSNQIDNNFYDSSDVFGLPIPRRFTLSVRLGF
jgi:TonB-linked SusC/RagA family outer membrane protein